MKLPAALVVLVLIAGDGAAQEQAAAPPPEPNGPAWSWLLNVSNVLESNINHDIEEGVRSYGVVVGAGAVFRNKPSRPTFELRYEIAGHSYTQTSRWDRVSHHMRASHEARLSRAWRLETVGEVSLGGSSEDFELNDQYMVQPRLEYRISPRDRVRVYGAYRARRYQQDRGRNASNKYVGVAFQQRVDEGPRWEIGLRYERNDPLELRHEFERWTYATGYAVPLSRRDLLTFEVNYRWKQNGHRLVKIEGERVPRVNQKWQPSAIWGRDMGSGMELQLGYVRESQTSNDPEKGYVAHQIIVTVARHW